MGEGKRKNYLIAFMDDHAMLIPYARFCLSEKLASFLYPFAKALLKRGLGKKRALETHIKSFPIVHANDGFQANRWLSKAFTDWVTEKETGLQISYLE